MYCQPWCVDSSSSYVKEASLQSQIFGNFSQPLEEMLGTYGLPAKVAGDIEERLTPVTYEKGAVIFLRGAPCEPYLLAHLKGS